MTPGRHTGSIWPEAYFILRPRPEAYFIHRFRVITTIYLFVTPRRHSGSIWPGAFFIPASSVSSGCKFLEIRNAHFEVFIVKIQTLILQRKMVKILIFAKVHMLLDENSGNHRRDWKIVVSSFETGELWKNLSNHFFFFDIVSVFLSWKCPRFYTEWQEFKDKKFSWPSGTPCRYCPEV